VDGIYAKYLSGDEGPRLHPIITYVAEEWEHQERARNKGQESIFNFEALKLPDILELCKREAAEHPTWNYQFHMPNLAILLKNQQKDNMWWLPPLDEVEDNEGAYTITYAALLQLVN
jgi:hypothetical protein